jgi:hypothetical protein
MTGTSDDRVLACRRSAAGAAAATAALWLGLLAVTLLPGAAGAESRRLCDMPMKWSYTKPAPDVPAKYQRLLGLWTGTVNFVGSGEAAHMCLAVAIDDVKADGQVGSTFAWNLGDGIESTNQVSVGTSPWSARTVVLAAGGPEQLVFGSITPFRGKWYRYVLDLPTAADPDTITGYLYGSMRGSATDPSPAAWSDVVEAHRVTLKRQKGAQPSFALPTN